MPAELAGLQADGSMNGYGGSLPPHAHLGPYGHPDYARSLAEYHGLPAGALDLAAGQQHPALQLHYKLEATPHLPPQQPGGGFLERVCMRVCQGAECRVLRAVGGVADMSQAAWPQQQQQAQQDAHSMQAPQQQLADGQQQRHHHMEPLPAPQALPDAACFAGGDAAQYGGEPSGSKDERQQQQQQPSLPSPEELRAVVSEGDPATGDAVACTSGTLGHVMLVLASPWQLL